MDRGAWEAAVRGVAEESDWTEHACTHARRFQARGSHTLVRELLAFISHELSEADGDQMIKVVDPSHPGLLLRAEERKGQSRQSLENDENLTLMDPLLCGFLKSLLGNLGLESFQP